MAASINVEGTVSRFLPFDGTVELRQALDVKTGEVKWMFRQHSPPWADVLSTAGDLVFAGSEEGNFFALNALNGEPVWRFQTGGRVRSNPISFAIDGKQHIAVSSGRALFVFGL